MKMNNKDIISEALEIVWEMKDTVYKETLGKTREDVLEYFSKSLQTTASELGGKLIKNDDGSYTIE